MPQTVIVRSAILCLAFFIGLIACTPPDIEVKVYPVHCDGIWKGQTCQGKMMALNRTVYRVSVARQDIIYWTPGFDLPPSRLVNCVVRDRKNWVGEYEDGSGVVRMANGKLQILPFYPPILYVEWWRWWFIHIKSYFYCEEAKK